MLEGVVNILKPPGMTSSDVVSDVRRIFETKKVGHAGTLDPGAAGVLPVCVGRATRLFDYLVDKDKIYIAEIAFGAETDTQDAYGTIIKSDCTADVSSERLEAVLPSFTGRIMQTAPVYSALNYKGQKMYKLARQGKPVEPKTREITVSSLNLIKRIDLKRFLLKIECSKGTYVRTLCHDIGKALNTCAYMSFLLRIKSGRFTIEDSYSIATLQELKTLGELDGAVTPVDMAVAHLPALYLDDITKRDKRLLTNGAPIHLPKRFCGLTNEGRLRIYAGDFIGIGGADGELVKVSTLLYAGEDV